MCFWRWVEVVAGGGARARGGGDGGEGRDVKHLAGDAGAAPLGEKRAREPGPVTGPVGDLGGNDLSQSEIFEVVEFVSYPHIISVQLEEIWGCIDSTLGWCTSFS